LHPSGMTLRQIRAGGRGDQSPEPKDVAKSARNNAAELYAAAKRAFSPTS